MYTLHNQAARVDGGYSAGNKIDLETPAHAKDIRQSPDLSSLNSGPRTTSNPIADSAHMSVVDGEPVFSPASQNVTNASTNAVDATYMV